MTGIAINTNVGALSAKAAVGSVNTAMETAMERLSSGKRINAAKDDAAGTSIATRLSAEIVSTNQAIRNALDAQALIDSAEGAHGELTSIIIRMRELAVQAVNDTNNIQDRQNLQLEVTALKEEIDRIAAVTTWAGKKLMHGSLDNGNSTAKTFTFQVGASQNTQDVISVDIKAMTSERLGLVDTLAFPTIDNLSQTGAVPKAEVSALSTAKNGVLSDVVTSGYTPVANDTLTLTADAVAGTLTPAVTVATANSAGSGNLTFKIDGQTITVTLAATDDTAAEIGTAIEAAITAAVNNNTISGVSAAADATTGVVTLTRTTPSLTGAYATAGNTNDYLLTIASPAQGAKLVVDIPVPDNVTTDGLDALNTRVSLTLDATTGASVSAAGTALAAAIRAAGISGYTAEVESNGQVRIVKSATPSLTIENGKSVGSPTVTSKNSTITVNTFDQGETLTFDVEGRSISVTNAAASGYTQDVKGTAAAIAAAINAKEIAGVTATVVDNVVTVTKANFNITSVTGSQTAMRLADAALELVNTQRATLGAVSNRLEKTVSNMTNVVTNLQAGRGRIEDADFAAESTELAKTQILQQASMAMLSQANASKQSVMSLLQGR